MAGGATDISFSDNNLIQGYSIDLYKINGSTGSTEFFTQWNTSVPSSIFLDNDSGYIGVIRQSQVARFNNFNELSADALDWVAANYIGLFFAAIIFLIIVGRR